MVQLSYPNITGKTIALAVQTFVGKMMSLLFNTLSRFVIAFLPSSKHLLISWLQSPSSVILEPKKILTLQVGNLRPRPSCHKATTHSSHRGQVRRPGSPLCKWPLTHPWAQVSVLRRCCKPQLQTVSERPLNPNWIPVVQEQEEPPTEGFGPRTGDCGLDAGISVPLG